MSYLWYLPHPSPGNEQRDGWQGTAVEVHIEGCQQGEAQGMWTAILILLISKSMLIFLPCQEELLEKFQICPLECSVSLWIILLDP